MAGKVRLNQDIVLSDVLYVPGFTHNLLSVAQLIQDRGIRCVFYETHCEFHRISDGKLIGTGRMQHNLYILDTIVENHFTHLFRTEEMTLG